MLDTCKVERPDASKPRDPITNERPLKTVYTGKAMAGLIAEQTKQAINRSYAARGMEGALRHALDIDHAIESQGSADKRAFMDIARAQGLKAALAWRDARFTDD